MSDDATKKMRSVWQYQEGAIFGRYRIIEELGKGGMGQVYKAYDTQLDRIVALKLLLAGDRAGAKERARFMREARATAALKHPHIVSIFDVGEQDGNPFFAMELVEGVSLKRLSRISQLSIKEIAQLMSKVARAVEYAHSQGIIHRDLKPDNILIDHEKQPKVMDFGLAKAAQFSEQLSQSGDIIGTIQYMAPEQIAGKTKEVDTCSDVYGLGAILYELLCSKPPFSGTTAMNVIFQMMNSEVTPPRKIRPRVPVALENICLKALAKDKRDRYQSAKKFAIDLHRFRKGRVTIAAPPNSRRKFWRRAAAVKILLAFAIVATAFALLWLSLDKVAPVEQTEKKTSDLTSSAKNQRDLAAAIQLYNGKKYTKARLRLEQVLLRESENPQANYYLAKIYYQEKSYFSYLQALDCIEKSLKAMSDEKIHREATQLYSDIKDGYYAKIGKFSRTEKNRLLFTGHRGIRDDDIARILSLEKSIRGIVLQKCDLLTKIAFVELAQNSRIEYLNLKESESVTDEAMEGIGQIKSLTQLILAQCEKLTSKGCGHLLHLQNLQHLDLYKCARIDDAGIQAIGNLPNLQTLKLSECKVTAVGLDSLSKLKLRVLSLANCTKIGNSGLKALAKIETLVELDLENTVDIIFDEGVEHLLQLKNLRKLNIRESIISPSSLQKLRDGLPDCEIIGP